MKRKSSVTTAPSRLGYLKNKSEYHIQKLRYDLKRLNDENAKEKQPPLSAKIVVSCLGEKDVVIPLT